MRLIEELIRKTLPRAERSVRNISDSIIDDYWADVCTAHNLKDYETFDEAYSHWLANSCSQVADIVLYYQKEQKKALIWTLYDYEDVEQCLIEDFLYPILDKNSCHGSWHEDVQAAILSYQNDE